MSTVVADWQEYSGARAYEWLSLESLALGELTDGYHCPRCERKGMTRRISFYYISDVFSRDESEDFEKAFARNFCSRCVQENTTDEEYAMHWRDDYPRSESEVKAASDAPWRGYGALLPDW